MYTFEPGSAHTATATVRNPQGFAADYTAEIYLVAPDGSKAATSGEVAFSLAAEEQKGISFNVVMPLIDGTYSVYLDVYSGGELVGAYQGVDDIAIVSVSNFQVSNLTITPSEPTVGELVVIAATVTNIGTTSGTYTVNCDISPDTYTPLEALVPAEIIPWSSLIQIFAIVVFGTMMVKMIKRR